MRTAIAAVVALSAVGTAPAAGQDPQWNRRGLDGGAVEFRLQNDDEAAINLVCHGQGVAVGFEFPTTLEPTERATVRSILSDTHQVGAQGHNDHRQNVAVARVGERVVRITSGRGTDMALQLLRDAAHLTYAWLENERPSASSGVTPSPTSAYFSRTKRTFFPGVAVRGVPHTDHARACAGPERLLVGYQQAAR